MFVTHLNISIIALAFCGIQLMVTVVSLIFHCCFKPISSPGTIFESVAELIIKKIFPQFEVGPLPYRFLVVFPCVTLVALGS